ncbi:hypothetical protein BDV27DRAFT_157122 [Aspergillus caelatus]|uniref:Uncharacterized protein n=1 Tax=Aspergillus caelatus TaxID=61420 RepID=A0A5N7A7U6_9EURO|nr:uncharacterized protein BDV27DRAFT_157122 [Aspergillus caelatus]KAE8365209.1 hypothetical protein BDV27DRAFT_157122 [Aspergillus caelatus]
MALGIGNRSYRELVLDAATARATGEDQAPFIGDQIEYIVATSFSLRFTSFKNSHPEIRPEDQVRWIPTVQLKVMPEDEELIARALAEFSPESTDTVTDHGYSQSAREDLRLGVEYVQEDFHSNERLQRIGFIGGPSEMSWVRDLNRAVEKDTEMLNANTPDQSPSDDPQALSKVSYFLDDQKMTIDDNIDVHIRSSEDIAERLVCLYFHTIHPSYSIISRLSFTQQLESYYTKPYLRPTKKWLAILNLVFAAAAKLAHFSTSTSGASHGSPYGVLLPGSETYLYR